MTIKLQVSKLERGVDKFARSIASMSDRLFLKKINQWSPRDVVAHLIGWNHYIIDGCKQLINGELPFYDVDPGDNYSKVNAELIRKYSSQDKQEMLAQLLASTRKVVEFIHSLEPDQWRRDYGVKNKGVTLTIRDTVAELIADYAHHRRILEDWMKTQHPRRRKEDRR